MSKIDWSKAPEWASRHGFAPAGLPCWIDGGGYSYEDKRQDGRYFKFSEGWDESEFSGITYRSPGWNGEGLPPVGTVCEVHNAELSNPQWERCTILFMGAFKCVYESESCHERVADVSDDGCITSFRPIRTPEQIAAEEREEAIKHACSVVGCVVGSQYGEVVQKIIDAGYRKVTP